MTQRFAILISFKGEPMSREMTALGDALAKLHWTVHDIMLGEDEDDTRPDEGVLDFTQQLWEKSSPWLL